MTRRNRYSAEFKAKLALEVVKGHRTLAEIASDAQGASQSAHPVEKATHGKPAPSLCR